MLATNDPCQITGSQLAERLAVSPASGDIFYTRGSRGRGGTKVPAGFIKPGTPSSGGGYRIISFPVGPRRYRHLRAHHVVWAWAYGSWPTSEIDHINGDRSDNRICNLRLATVSQNRINRKNSETRTSGFKWVTFDKQSGRWIAQIEAPKSMMVGGKRRMLFRQSFGSGEAAYAAACEFASTLFGPWFNPGQKSLTGG